MVNVIYLPVSKFNGLFVYKWFNVAKRNVNFQRWATGANHTNRMWNENSQQRPKWRRKFSLEMPSSFSIWVHFIVFWCDVRRIETRSEKEESTKWMQSTRSTTMFRVLEIRKYLIIDFKLDVLPVGFLSIFILLCTENTIRYKLDKREAFEWNDKMFCCFLSDCCRTRRDSHDFEHRAHSFASIIFAGCRFVVFSLFHCCSRVSWLRLCQTEQQR